MLHNLCIFLQFEHIFELSKDIWALWKLNNALGKFAAILKFTNALGPLVAFRNLHTLLGHLRHVECISSLIKLF
jgi:hypothetical protein